MKTRFLDLEHPLNPRNGDAVCDQTGVLNLFDALQRTASPFMCQFTGENGFNLTVGIGGDFGCVQHGANDGSLPYLMAISRQGGVPNEKEMEFAVGGTATPISGRYRLDFDTLRRIVGDFVATGKRSGDVEWEEFDPRA